MANERQPAGASRAGRADQELVITDAMLSRAWQAFCDAEQRVGDYGAALTAALEAALAGRVAVSLPPAHQLGTRHGLWLVEQTRIEAGLLAGQPIVAIDGAERSPDVVRRRALAMLAAANYADQIVTVVARSST